MAINHSSVYHFADDTNLLNINTSPKRIQKQINLDIKYKWLLANKISLNCSKTELRVDSTHPEGGSDPSSEAGCILLWVHVAFYNRGEFHHVRQHSPGLPVH